MRPRGTGSAKEAQGGQDLTLCLTLTPTLTLSLSLTLTLTLTPTPTQGGEDACWGDAGEAGRRAPLVPDGQPAVTSADWLGLQERDKVAQGWDSESFQPEFHGPLLPPAARLRPGDGGARFARRGPRLCGRRLRTARRLFQEAARGGCAQPRSACDGDQRD